MLTLIYRYNDSDLRMKICKLIIVSLVFSILFVYTFSPRVLAASSGSNSTTVSATVGQYYLNITGYIAPFASIVLLSNDQPLKTTTADLNGYFSFSSVLISKGFSGFCLDAVDVKRLGESYKCFSFAPANKDVSMQNLFLPPTLGLQRGEINQGDQAVMWGYSMPGANVVIHFSNGQTYTVTADSSGYYEIRTTIDKAGQYELFADATYQSKKSLTPDKKVSLLALSTSEQIAKIGQNWLNTIWKFLTGSPWGIVLAILPILILILILIHKLKPEWFTVIDQDFHRMASHIPFIRHKLHHWWFVGY